MAEEIGVDPLKILMYFASGNWKALGYDSEVYHFERADGSFAEGFVITPNMRLTAAKEIAPYIYAKRKEEPEPEILDVTPESEEEAAKEALDFIKQKYPKLLEE